MPLYEFVCGACGARFEELVAAGGTRAVPGLWQRARHAACSRRSPTAGPAVGLTGAAARESDARRREREAAEEGALRRRAQAQAGPGTAGRLIADAGVELVSQSAIDAYNRRDLARLRELMTDDVDLRPPVSALTGRAYVGHDGIAEWLRDVDESFASAQIVPLELRDLGGRCSP